MAAIWQRDYTNKKNIDTTNEIIKILVGKFKGRCTISISYKYLSLFIVETAGLKIKYSTYNIAISFFTIIQIFRIKN